MARTTVVQNHNARKKCPERHFVGRLSHFLALAQIFPSGFSSFDPLEAPSTGRRDTIGMSQNAHWHVHNRLEKLLRWWKRVLLRLPYFKNVTLCSGSGSVRTCPCAPADRCDETRPFYFMFSEGFGWYIPGAANLFVWINASSASIFG